MSNKENERWARKMYEAWQDSRREVADWKGLSAKEKAGWRAVAREAWNSFK